MVEGSEQILLLVDDAEHILAVTPNIQATIGLIPSQIVGQPYRSILGLSAAADQAELHLKDRGSSQPSQIIHRKLSDGNMAAFEVTLHKLDHPSSERKRLQVVQLQGVSQVQAHESQRASFLSTMAHELRTPLAVIRGYSEILLRPELLLAGGEDAAFYAAGIYAETHHLATLIDVLLDVSSLESGRLHLQRDWLDLVDLTRDVIQDSADSERVVLILPASVPPVWADARRIKRVLAQVLIFMLNHSPANRAITVNIQSLSEKTPSLRLTLHDSGASISLQQQAELFAELYVFAATGQSPPGLGLGLCRAILAAHGGTLTLDSQPGQGATLTLELPVLKTKTP